MIKNERQHQLAKAQLAKSQQALRQVRARPTGAGGPHPMVRKAQEEGLQKQVDDLTAQLAEYDAAHVAAESPESTPETEEPATEPAASAAGS